MKSPRTSLKTKVLDRGTQPSYAKSSDRGVYFNNMVKERNKAVPAAYLVLIKEGMILLARRYNTGYYDGYYSLPAGHVEAGELPIDTLVREIKEEIGIDIDRSNAQLGHVMYRTKHDETGDRTDFFFLANGYQGEVINQEPQKCDNVQWFPTGQLPENTIPYIRIVIGKIEQKIVSSELGLDTIPTNS